MKSRQPYAGRYSYTNNKRIHRIQKTMDMLAYGSLLLDVCIAAVTALSILEIRTGEMMLVPIHYMLTSVVAMSLLSGSMLLYLKHNERIMEDILRIKYRVSMMSSKSSPHYPLRRGISKNIGSKK